LLEKKKNWLGEQLQAVDIKIKEINKNAQFMEEKIY
jgi:hypothetical protein